MSYVIERPPKQVASSDDESVKIMRPRQWWCIYASGDRWNNRISHAKKFETQALAEGYADTLGLKDREIILLGKYTGKAEHEAPGFKPR